MTLLDAPEYDFAKKRRQRNLIVSIVIACCVIGGLAWHFRNWREVRVVNKFFATIQAGDLPKAFGIWNNDPNWQQHTQKYSSYPYGRFLLDWGKSSDWGVIRSHKITAVKRAGSGVVVGIEVNGNKTPVFLWVQRNNMTLGFSPVQLSTD